MITIERLNLRGEGVADGVTIARVLPGEEVEGTCTDGRIAQPRILTPSAHRVAASCRHYKACGGCSFMHASDDFVADWKQEVVRHALAAQGLDAPFRPIVTSPPNSRRRAVFAGRRLKSGALVGFHARASDTVTPIPNCQLLAPELLAVIPALEGLVSVGASRKAEMKLTVTTVLQGVDVAAVGGKPLDDSLRGILPEIAVRYGLIRLSWDGEIVCASEPPLVAFGSTRVSPPPGAFLQATLQGEQALQHAVLEAVGAPVKVADLFAGCGTFALPIARSGEVLAVEGAGDLLAALDVGWRKSPGLKRVETERRDLFRRPMLPEELTDFDAVVIDPPRAGAQAQTRELAKAQIPTIAFVSCNPVTFARDAKTLCDAGYAIDWMQVVDQFRWSSHVELVAKFTHQAN